MKKLLIIISLCLFAFSLSAQQNKKPTVVSLEIGDDMPNFALKGVDEKVYTPDDFLQYEFLVVIFTCNHCPTAQAYEERISKLFDDFNKKGVGFIGISPNNNDALSLAECGYTDLDDSFESMKIRANDINLKFPYLYDGETSATSVKFGPVATPHVFIFDKDRKLRYRGRIDDMESPYEKATSHDTRIAINALLKGEKVQQETTKTFGCSIKWPWKNEWTKQLIQNWANEDVILLEASKDTLKNIIHNDSENLCLINVWATYCGPCVMEFPDLVETYRMYNGRGFEFISVSMDRPNSKDHVLEFLTKNQSSDKNYIWSGKTSYEAVDLIDPDWQGSLPYTLLLKPGGEIIYKHEGPVNILELRKAIIGELGRYFADDN